jgi:hypothetical protein
MTALRFVSLFLWHTLVLKAVYGFNQGETSDHRKGENMNHLFA